MVIAKGDIVQAKKTFPNAAVHPNTVLHRESTSICCSTKKDIPKRRRSSKHGPSSWVDLYTDYSWIRAGILRHWRLYLPWWGQHVKSRPNKKLVSYDLPELSVLPPGQRRAAEALLGTAFPPTYPQAAELAGISLGTLLTQLTHGNRSRQRHPALYTKIRPVRLAQLADRHEDALARARAHSALYFRKRAKWMLRRW